MSSCPASACWNCWRGTRWWATLAGPPSRCPPHRPPMAPDLRGPLLALPASPQHPAQTGLEGEHEREEEGQDHEDQDPLEVLRVVAHLLEHGGPRRSHG